MWPESFSRCTPLIHAFSSLRIFLKASLSSSISHEPIGGDDNLINRLGPAA